MQQKLQAAGKPAGFVKIENGEPIGLYYPSNFHDDIAQALNYAPDKVEVPQTQEAAAAQATPRAAPVDEGQ